MRRPKLLHPTTADHRREIDIRVLTKAGAFRTPMRFPFMRVEVPAHDHIRLYPLSVATHSARMRAPDPQVIRVTWRKMTFGYKPFFVCPRCNARRVYLYFDTLQAYCRACGNLRFLSHRQCPRTRLLHRSHRIRVWLGDQFGKPGDKFPARPFNRKQRGYHKDIARLIRIEQRYLHMTEIARRNLYRERDELGRFVCAEHDTQTSTELQER
jgi:hypothetical protein